MGRRARAAEAIPDAVIPEVAESVAPSIAPTSARVALLAPDVDVWPILRQPLPDLLEQIRSGSLDLLARLLHDVERSDRDRPAVVLELRARLGE